MRDWFDITNFYPIHDKILEKCRMHAFIQYNKVNKIYGIQRGLRQ